MKKNEKKPKHVKNEYSCIACDYVTNKKSNYCKHIKTKKHLQNVQIIQKMKKKYKKETKKNTKIFMCENCCKTYTYKSGLSRHRKKCEDQEQSDNEYIDDDTYHNMNTSSFKNEPNNDDIIKLLVQQNKTHVEQTNNALNLVQQSLNEMSKMVPKIGNNNNNTNKISINVFLNENCKDAMNLTKFVQNIQVSLEDLMYTKDNGYVKGITNILTKQLNDLKPNERPIHCSDKKRLQFYIKDNDVWEKNESEEKLDKTIRDMEREQIRRLAEWEKINPNYLKDPKLLKEWQTIIHQIIDHANEGDKTKTMKKIKTNIAEYVEIKDDLKNV